MPLIGKLLCLRHIALLLSKGWLTLLKSLLLSMLMVTYLAFIVSNMFSDNKYPIHTISFWFVNYKIYPSLILTKGRANTIATDKEEF